MNKTNFIESVLRDQEEKIKQLESQNESLKQRCAELEKECNDANETIDELHVDINLIETAIYKYESDTNVDAGLTLKTIREAIIQIPIHRTKTTTK